MLLRSHTLLVATKPQHLDWQARVSDHHHSSCMYVEDTNLELETYYIQAAFDVFSFVNVSLSLFYKKYSPNNGDDDDDVMKVPQ